MLKEYRQLKADAIEKRADFVKNEKIPIIGYTF
jgi:hypothetical protein